MNGVERRSELVNLLMKTEEPISGTTLAKMMHVSRQVIVQDIAILRAENLDIISTTKGYVISKKKESIQRVFTVKHTTSQMQDELNLIVDCGGYIHDVIVEHPVYGKISADLKISSRQDVNEFMDRVRNSKTVPLKELTKDVHRHTVSAQSEAVLDIIEGRLRKENFLIE